MEENYYETENEIMDTEVEADDGITAGKVAEGAGIVAIAGLALYGTFQLGKKGVNKIRSIINKKDSEEESSEKNDSKKK